ncbi:polyketide cyclase [Sphingomonas spermidinifaciens]|uniref:Polyketide cyclase n=1 Tax=Sphingomonas spermidinifaciens TaxID=1141889 RepID=A0A2A4B185_9SPHN|nr:polyketide cyclase [Sphingomonas spermidinifaciens]
MPKPGVFFFATYFHEDRHGDLEDVVARFTADATVRDEDVMNRGHDAVGAWKTKSPTVYSYTSEPLAVTTTGDQTIVTSHLVGDFPGNPLDLRYLFTLRDSKIAALEIQP